MLIVDGGTREIPHNRKELEKLLEVARGARSILEVGSRYGQTLKLLAAVMSCKGRVVSVDLPNGPWGHPKSDDSLNIAISELRSEGYEAYVMFGDSKDQRIVSAAKQLGPYDFVFIDGDHTYEGVKKDWENYGPLGTTVVFHDILQTPRQALGVWRLWAEIEGEKETFIADDSTMGIGIVRQYLR